MDLVTDCIPCSVKCVPYSIVTTHTPLSSIFTTTISGLDLQAAHYAPSINRQHENKN